ncbi:MAG: hypothetical protein Kow0092_23540 [Deferrisomatales bacterium]
MRPVACLLLWLWIGPVLCAAGEGPGVPEGSHGPPDRPVAWSSLDYRARKWLGKAQARLRAERVPAGPGAPAPEGEGGALLLRVDTEIDPLFGSTVRLGDRAWLSPGSLAALRQVRTRSGQDPYEKRYRFTPTGVHRVRASPADGEEAKRPPAAWSQVKESFYEYPAGGPPCAEVTTPSALLYLASTLVRAGAAALDREVCVFDRKVLYRVRLEARRVRLDARSLSPLGAPLPAKAARGVWLAFDPRPAGKEGAAGGGGFSFLGFSGSFQALFEETTGVPLRIEGRVPGLGRIEFSLREVEWARGGGGG